MSSHSVIIGKMDDHGIEPCTSRMRSISLQEKIYAKRALYHLS